MERGEGGESGMYERRKGRRGGGGREGGGGKRESNECKMGGICLGTDNHVHI